MSTRIPTHQFMSTFENHLRDQASTMAGGDSIISRDDEAAAPDSFMKEAVTEKRAWMRYGRGNRVTINRAVDHGSRRALGQLGEPHSRDAAMVTQSDINDVRKNKPALAVELQTVFNAMISSPLPPSTATTGVEKLGEILANSAGLYYPKVSDYERPNEMETKLVFSDKLVGQAVGSALAAGLVDKWNDYGFDYAPTAIAHNAAIRDADDVTSFDRDLSTTQLRNYIQDIAPYGTKNDVKAMFSDGFEPRGRLIRIVDLGSEIYGDDILIINDDKSGQSITLTLQYVHA